MKTQKIFNEILASDLCKTGGKDIDLAEAILRLCDAIKSEDDTDWSLGECDEFDLASFIVAAYWAMSEWHGGQSSIEYAALCALGSIYTPNMSGGVEPDSAEANAYDLINDHYVWINQTN